MHGKCAQKSSDRKRSTEKDLGNFFKKKVNFLKRKEKIKIYKNSLKGKKR
jgi:hypothetical protein